MRNVLAASWFRFTSLNCLFWQIEHLAWRNTSLIGSPSKWINDDFNHFYLSFSTVFCGSCISAFLHLPVSLLDFLFCARALVTTWLWSGKEKKNHDLAWNTYFVATITDGEGPTSRRRKKKKGGFDATKMAENVRRAYFLKISPGVTPAWLGITPPRLVQMSNFGLIYAWLPLCEATQH